MEIKGQHYELKYGLRSMFIFESMTDKPFSITTLFDTYIFFYCCIVANPDNPQIDFNDFLDWCDEHPDVINEFNEFMSAQMKKNETLSPKKKETKRGRPKKSSTQ